MIRGRIVGEMRVVFLLLLLTVESAGRSGLASNNRAMKQTFQNIAKAQTDLLLTTVDLIFFQVNELVANLTEKLTMFENRLLEVERHLGRVEAESMVKDDDHDRVTETPTEEPTGHDVIISLIKGMNHLLVEKTDAIDNRLENLENEVSNFQWRDPQRTDKGDGQTVSLAQESPQPSDQPQEGSPDRTFSSVSRPFAPTTIPTRTDQSEVSTAQTRTTIETSSENPLHHFLFKICNITPTFNTSNSGSVIHTVVTTSLASSVITSPIPSTSVPTSATTTHTPVTTKSTTYDSSVSTSATTTHTPVTTESTLISTIPFTTKLTSVSTAPVTTNSSNHIITSTVQSPLTTSEIVTTVEASTSKAIPKTCTEVWQNKLQEPGNYLIDPDGTGGTEPFRAYCDEGFTIVRHRRAYVEMRVSNYEEPGSFVYRPKYPVSAEQLKALTAKSQFCDQYIKYECRSAVLLFGSKDRGSINYGWLLSIDGEKLINWGGAPTNSSLCACGVDDSCVRPGLPCNCDGDLRIKLIDEGVLMDKNVLPITEVRLGDTGGRKENGRLWLGSLRCFD